MKHKMLTICFALTSAYASAQSAASYQTTEYYKSKTLDPIKASSAYARGYTGAGSIIAVLDTGIDLTSPEFKNKIVLTKDFSGSISVQDTYGHGTHVAGIAAAANNGMGMEGVAYGSSLMIGKISSGPVIITANTMKALDWASTNGATVANISSGAPIGNVNPKLVSPGVYTTTLTNASGKYLGGMDPTQWAPLMKNDIVVVFAAGNDGTPYPSSSGAMATAVDNSGNLILGGRVLIAGNWNSQTNQPGINNNGSASLCAVYASGVCQDKYKISDFYLMAPGMNIQSTVPTSVNNSGYASMSGTSMAAPAISGGVAIIHQMWPKMTGANIVKLLLATANKNLPNYNVNVMGQGLMDLDRATQPVGAVGIPTIGRATTKAITPILITNGSASTSKLTSFMVMDSFERDFYVDGNVLTSTRKAEPLNVVQAALPYVSKNAYSQLINNVASSRAVTGNFEINVYNNAVQTQKPSMLEVSYIRKSNTLDTAITVGVLSETNTWLGNSVSNISSSENRSTTYIVGTGASKSFDSGTAIYANVTHGITHTNDQSADIAAIGTVSSYSWNIGFEHKFAAKHTVGLMAYQPVNVYHANASVNIPVGFDSQYNIVNANNIDLSATTKEHRTGIYYKSNDGVLAFIENRKNYQGQDSVSNTVAGITVTKQF